MTFRSQHGPLRVGVGGPVGSGKTTLVEVLCKSCATSIDLIVITNDIYTREDRFLTRARRPAGGADPGGRDGRLPAHGDPRGCLDQPGRRQRHGAQFPAAQICFIELGGDNLAATFCPELADITLYVIDVAAGEKIPRKGGPGITRSDLLVINKTDLAPLVGASLEVMDRDARKMRGQRPFVFTNLKTGEGLDRVSESS